MKKIPAVFNPSLLFLIVFLLLSQLLVAQTSSLTIKLVNEKKQPIPGVTVVLTNWADVSQVQKEVSDAHGIALFRVRKSGQYTIQTSAVNYQPFEKGIRVQGAATFSFTLNASSTTLGNVVVKSSRPLMKQEDDKTVVDPENLIPSSTSGYEVLEKTPGIFVDQDGNIYLNSTTPATVYINGREMKMSTSDVATMLKSLPPNAISKIEILRSPSAKYDASGSGGIVNVVLKKGVKPGMTGTATAGWQQGKYGNEIIGLNLNNNNGRMSSYANINFSKRNNYEQIRTDRLLAKDTVLGQDAYTKYPANVYYLGYGLNYEISKTWDISYDGRASLNDFNNHTDNQSTITKISTGELFTNNLTRVNNNGTAFFLSQGVSAKYKIDSSGSQWTNDFSYNFSQNNTDQVFSTTYSTPPLPATGGDGNSLNKRNFYTLQSDISLKFRKQTTLEAGAKTTFLYYNSATDYFRNAAGIEEKDPTRTNTFRYNENINAIYAQVSKGFSDVLLKIGTRLENTNMDGRQIIPFDTSFTIHRTDLFPYAYLSKKIMRIAGFDIRAYLIYRRTIQRPVYEQLNPFPRYIDNYLTEIGNPALRPQFTRNYEANISVDDTPLLAFGLNDTKDIFTNVIYTSDTSLSHAYRTYDNLGTNREFYIRGLGAIPPGKKYFFVVGGQYNHNFYQGYYENKPLDFKKGTWTFFTYHTLKLGRFSQATLNGFIRLKGQLQFYELSPFGSLNASINRQFFKQKVVLTLSVNDMFATNRNEFVMNQGSVNASGYRKADTRRFGINLRYNFGVRKKEEGQNVFNMESPEKTN